jgi:starch synthase (maltosyl-transferring)
MGKLTPVVYNLFPRLVGPTTRWAEHAARAREMGFDWLYLNPWQFPGFSGSLYSIKDPRRLNPLFVPPGADPSSLEPLRRALSEVRALGLRPMMDLVVNHTSKDAPLIRQHPEWFRWGDDGQVKSPFVVDPDDPSKVTVWGDLADMDNQPAQGREEQWRYWAALVREALELGFQGFRCDAAYKVPASLWRYLIDEAKRVDPGTVFFAETLGAPVEDVAALAGAGFDFFFNSSKWWNFSEPWALEQHEAFRHVAPSVSFPESHDTERLAAETGGDEAVQRQRYAFAAAFSAGVMMPVGYEFGFRTRMDVVRTMPTHWERRWMDLRNFVARVNHLKRDHPVLHGEGVLRAPGGIYQDTLVLERRASDAPAAAKGWVLVNKVWAEPREVRVGELAPEALRSRGYRLFRVCIDRAPQMGEPVRPVVALGRAEVAYVLPELSADAAAVPPGPTPPPVIHE